MRLNNPKHEKYCQYRALGDSQADCFIKSHNKDASKSSRTTWANMGYQLEKDSMVSCRINELKDWEETKMLATRKQIAQNYLDVISDDFSKGADRVSANTGLAKMLGYNEPIRLDISFSNDEAIAKTFASLFEEEEEEDEEE